jgi:hypothetical protein
VVPSGPPSLPLQSSVLRAGPADCAESHPLRERSATASLLDPPLDSRQPANATMNEIDIVRDISQKFEQAGIPYMLTGSMAMNYYAQPRMTRDIDVVIAIAPKHVEPLIHLFGQEYYVSSEGIRESLANESAFNVIHQESVIKVDCIVRKRGEYRRLEFERRQKIKLLDFTTFIVSKEDLIISKLFWAKDSHSEMQLRDVRNLLTTGYDKEYLEHWTRELNLDTLLRESLND